MRLRQAHFITLFIHNFGICSQQASTRLISWPPFKTFVLQHVLSRMDLEVKESVGQGREERKPCCKTALFTHPRTKGPFNGPLRWCLIGARISLTQFGHKTNKGYTLLADFVYFVCLRVSLSRLSGKCANFRTCPWINRTIRCR